MKQKRYIILLVILIFISPSIYQNYLYYKIPYNPTTKIPTEKLKSIQYHLCDYLQYNKDMAHEEEGYVYYNSTNREVFFKICDYLRKLKLKPIKEGSIDIYESKYVYKISSYHPYDYDIYVLVSQNDLSKVYIKVEGIKNLKLQTSYQITNGEFNYEYINNLIKES